MPRVGITRNELAPKANTSRGVLKTFFEDEDDDKYEDDYRELVPTVPYGLVLARTVALR